MSLTRKSRIRSLRPSEPRPEGEPRRYTDSRGYTRLRWKVGKGEYVETYERDASGDLRRDRAAAKPRHQVPPSRVDWEKAVHLYVTEGWPITRVSTELGCNNATLSRGLRARGVAMRRKRDYEDGFEPNEVLRLYRQGYGCDDAARLAGTTYTRAAEVIKEAGLMRRAGRPKNANPNSYEIEFRRQRPAVLERAGHRCEAAVEGVCEQRVDHVHHRRLRRQGGTNDLDNLLAVCRPCHTHIHANPTWSYDRGFLLHMVAS